MYVFDLADARRLCRRYAAKRDRTRCIRGFRCAPPPAIHRSPLRGCTLSGCIHPIVHELYSQTSSQVVAFGRMFDASTTIVVRFTSEV